MRRLPSDIQPRPHLPSPASRRSLPPHHAPQRPAARRPHPLAAPAGSNTRTSVGDGNGVEWDAVTAIRAATEGAVQALGVMSAFVAFGLAWAWLAQALPASADPAQPPSAVDPVEATLYRGPSLEGGLAGAHTRER